jgi:16S rRNA (guanine527-N7)-methyltransferase
MSGEAPGTERDLFSPASSPRLIHVIGERARKCGLELADTALAALALHARRVRERNDELHLTSIRDPREFVERHLGESLEGAAMLEPGVEGALLDLGSGNGYPGLAVASARPGLSPLLAEAARAKAAFLRGVVEEAFPGGDVLEGQVQRPADLGGAGPFSAIVTRALGNWERVLPRLAPALEASGTLLVWTGVQMETVAKRKTWGRYRLVERKPLPGRERSWIWRFEPA